MGGGWGSDRPGRAGSQLHYLPAEPPPCIRRRVLLLRRCRCLNCWRPPGHDRPSTHRYYYGTNALHAFREATCVKGADGTTHCPTSFPTPPNYGAAFNRSLSAAMGRSFGTELRAMYNARSVHSLDTWSPTINLARDPRWGRTDETPSEDPYVLGQHALHSVLGAQNGPDPIVPMIGVTLKHWIGNNVEGGARGVGAQR